MVNRDPAAVWRALDRAGVLTRSRHDPSHNRKDIDSALIVRWYEEGLSGAEMARRLGVTHSPIDRRLKELGLRPHPVGRQPKK